MSGDTVTGQALQFTNDNKNAYAFSGLINAPSGGGTALLFTTESYYLETKLTCASPNAYTNDVTMELLFNDVVAFSQIYTNTAQEYITGLNPYEFIIPPHTKVELIFKNTSGGGTSNWYSMLTAKVGMPQRVGNLDD